MVALLRVLIVPSIGASAIALAIGVGVALCAALTLLPAIMVLTGRRGWIKPRRELTTRFWRRSGIRIVRRPKASLLASLIAPLSIDEFFARQLAEPDLPDHVQIADADGSVLRGGNGGAGRIITSAT